MITTPKVLVVIPARGGSKGIPRKNLRTLNGNPLIYYSIKNALKVELITDVYVTSEDDEILIIAKNFGARIHKREQVLAEDSTTLDPVIYNCYLYAQEENNVQYDFIVTMQPTSPLLTSGSIEKALHSLLNDENTDTIISCVNDTHLNWKKENERFEPLYKERVNRQYLDPVYKETGGFLMTRSSIISKNNRIGTNVNLFELSGGESIDIDTYEDWALCEYLLKRKTIVFVVRGNNEIGLGHVINTLSIANDILNHNIVFYCLSDSKLAHEIISNYNYSVYLQTSSDIVDEVMKLQPSVVINDCLDTELTYIEKLRRHNQTIINIEDLGSGSNQVDLLINAMYENKLISQDQFYGFEYFILKQEFLHLPTYEVTKTVKRVLITFGGVDPCNLTLKVLQSIHSYCVVQGIEITIIAGMGYTDFESISNYEGVIIQKSVKDISTYMLQTDIAFSSGGRTTFELASIGIPTIVLCQNERELTHTFCSSNNGFVNLGLGEQTPTSVIEEKFIELSGNYASREKMFQKYNEFDLKKGKTKVMELINNVINKTT